MEKARTNSLKVEEVIGRGSEGRYDTRCKLCKREEEDLIHFLIKCPKLQASRDGEIFKHIPNASPRDQAIRLLFKEKKLWPETANMIMKMWRKRRELLG